MIAITEKEKKVIRQSFQKLHMVRTMKHDSKRHHYYMEESAGAMKLLHKIRFGDV